MDITQWTPTKELEGNFTLEALHDDHEGFRLILKSEKTERTLQILFDPALSYRNIDEGDLLNNTEECSINGGFYKIKNSPYLKWFHKQSVDTWANKNVTHYAIYTQNDCIDVLTTQNVMVKWLN